MIKGERVALRPVDVTDGETIWSWHREHEFTVLDGHIYPPTLAATRDWLLSLPSPAFHNVTFAIEREDGVLMGYTSLKRVEPEDRNAEFGIALGPEYWNQGYGTDATRTMLRFAFMEINLHRVLLRVLDDNARARRVYEKCGFVVEGRLREARFSNGRWHDKIVMGILDREFFALQHQTGDRSDAAVAAGAQ